MDFRAVRAFDRTLQISNEWLEELQREFRWPDRRKAYLALRAVLHTLRDCLIVEEAVDLAAQMPMLLRGMFFEGWVPAKVPLRMDLEAFLDAVRSHFRHDPKIDAESVVRGVFRVLSGRISRGELHDVRNVLPDELKALWPAWVV